VAGRDDHPVPGGDKSIVDRTHIAGRWAYPGTLIPQRLERQQARAAQDEVRLDHSRKWLSITRSLVKPSSLSAPAVTCSAASSGRSPISSPRSTRTPAAFARVSTSRQTVSSDVVVWSRRFIET